MSPFHAIPVLLAIVVGLALGLVFWGFLRTRSHETAIIASGSYDALLLGMLVLAAFSLGAFVAFVMLSSAF